MPREIYRKEAVERLSSPERLDLLMPVTSPRDWLSLAGLGMIIFIVLTWSVLGSIPTTVEASGALIRRKGVTPLDAPVAGTVDRILADSGVKVTKGQDLVALMPPGPPNRQPIMVKSPRAARVLGWRTRPGDAVLAGAALLMLEPLDEPLDARVFIPVSQGYQVEKGMEVQIWPSYVRQSEFGYLKGHVQFASKYPITPDDMMGILQDQEMVKQLTRSGPCLQVLLELQPDPKTASGYSWTTAPGGQLQLFSGTPCDALIIVSRHRPIQLILQNSSSLTGK